MEGLLSKIQIFCEISPHLHITRSQDQDQETTPQRLKMEK